MCLSYDIVGFSSFSLEFCLGFRSFSFVFSVFRAFYARDPARLEPYLPTRSVCTRSEIVQTIVGPVRITNVCVVDFASLRADKRF